MDLFNIQNRRYLGNKYRLTEFIRQTVDRECSNVNTVLDAFSGTGAVSYIFKDKQLIVNDMMYSCFQCIQTWFSPESFDIKKIEKIINDFNLYNASNESNYMSEIFGNTYFSLETCKKIGYIREKIEDLFRTNTINNKERAILITSLIYAMDREANTYGHYDSYIRDGNYKNTFVLKCPDLNYRLNSNNQCYNMDANVLAKKISCDVAYLDPPYNSRNYCDAYHLLENVALWQKPDVFGIAKKLDRTHMKSEYCKSTANEALEDLITNLKCRYIVLSYNNNGTNLQIRSNAKISDSEIIRILSKRGEVKVFEQNYRPFSAGRGKNENNSERLFICYVQK